MPPEVRNTPTPPEAADAPPNGHLLVACLCADWCSACRAYRAVFDRAAAENPDFRFLWVDVEDSAALVDPIDVENFPTILIGDRENPRFFGPITPQRDVLLHLIASNRRRDVGGVPGAPALRDLLRRLQAIAG